MSLFGQQLNPLTNLFKKTECQYSKVPNVMLKDWRVLTVLWSCHTSLTLVKRAMCYNMTTGTYPMSMHLLAPVCHLVVHGRKQQTDSSVWRSHDGRVHDALVEQEGICGCWWELTAAIRWMHLEALAMGEHWVVSTCHRKGACWAHGSWKLEYI